MPWYGRGLRESALLKMLLHSHAYIVSARKSYLLPSRGGGTVYEIEKSERPAL